MVQEKQVENTAKITEIEARVNLDNEQVVDNTERLDKIDRDIKLNDVRIKEVEDHISEISKEKEENNRMLIMEKEIKQIKEQMKNNPSDDKSPKVVKSPIIKSPKKQFDGNRSSPQGNNSLDADKYKEARGKIGLYPISCEDIRVFSDGKTDDVELMTKYDYIEVRHSAAQWFLESKMHFQKN